MDRITRTVILLALGFIIVIANHNHNNIHTIMDRPTVVFIEDGVAIPGIKTLEEKKFTIREFTVTAYCPCEKCCGKWSDRIFYDGTKCGGVAIAADRSIPIGTVMKIPGYGTAIVRDRGSAIKGNRLDVYFDSHQNALNWGVHKNIKVKIYEN